jgi:prophage DNA circulation protein
MAFQDIKDLQQGSFKGVPFLFVGSSTSGGRKNVFYEYPNTDKRGLSDLGLKLKDFTPITIYVTGNSTSDYKQNRDRFISVLESKGAGILVHPTFGQINCAVDGYTIDENISHINRADFSVNFREVSEPIKPAATQNNIPKIENIAVDTISKVSTDIENNYNVSSGNFANFETVKAKAETIVDKFSEISEQVEKRTEFFNDFANTVREFDSKINSIIVQPLTYATEMKNLFDGIRLIASDPAERFLMFTKLFNFGSDDMDIKSDTSFKIERKENNKIINNAINSNSLAYAHATLKEIELQNEDEFNRYNELLNNQWELLQGSDLDTDVRENILDLRAEVEKYIDTLNLPELITVETLETSPTILSYQYYGDTSRDNQISTLNALKDYGVISGDITLQSDF